MTDELYHKEILRLAGLAHSAGRLTPPCCTGRAVNAMCGDSVIFDAVIDAARRPSRLANEVRGCLLVQASASLLAKTAPGADAQRIAALPAEVSAMLKGGPAPAAPFDGFDVFRPVAEYKSRHACVMLPLEALAEALKNCPPVSN